MLKKIPFFQYYLTKEKVGENRAEVTVEHLRELNSYVAVHDHKENLSEDFLKKFKVCLKDFEKLILIFVIICMYFAVM